VTGPRAIAAPGRVIERGRSKAHRPLPADVRRAAVARGLAAYERGAWYLAHEELEPAWMGTADLAERALLSGLIKVAAAYVHAERGNALGVRTNLRGARERLAAAAVTAPAAVGAPTGPAAPKPGSTGATERIDLPALLSAVDDRLARIEVICDGPEAATTGSQGADVATVGASPAALDAGPAVPPHDVAGPAGRFRRAPVAIPPIPIPRTPA
jgi:Domain of unknown function (DUF309)